MGRRGEVEKRGRGEKSEHGAARSDDDSLEEQATKQEWGRQAGSRGVKRCEWRGDDETRRVMGVKKRGEEEEKEKKICPGH